MSEAWRVEAPFSERLVAEAPDLGVTGIHDNEAISPREVLARVIEGYARNNGHAGFLRERIDGGVGQ